MPLPDNFWHEVTLSSARPMHRISDDGEPTRSRSVSYPTIGEARRHMFGSDLPTGNDGDLTNSEMVDPSFVGIELELEGGVSSDGLPRAFVMEPDNSLRNNGIEIKSRRGHRGRALESAIARLGAYLEGKSYSLSERCSTHIHVDVNDLSPQQAVNFLCLSVMLEPMLFKLFGNSRTANNFCMCTDMGTSNFSNIVKSVQNPDSLLNQRWSKYAGIGLFRLNDYGTFEFRMFTAITNSADMMNLVQLLLAIKSYARTMTAPESIIDRKLSESVENIFSTFFPRESFTEEFNSSMERGIRTLNDILMSARVIQMIEERSKGYKAVVSEARRKLEQLERGL